MKKADEREIQRIQARLYAKYKPRLYKTQPKANVVLEVVGKALTEHRDKFSEEQLKDLEAIQASGELEGTEKVIVPEIAELYEKEMEREISKAIKEGRLTDPKDDPDLQAFKNRHYGKGSK